MRWFAGSSELQGNHGCGFTPQEALNHLVENANRTLPPESVVKIAVLPCCFLTERVLSVRTRAHDWGETLPRKGPTRIAAARILNAATREAQLSA